jgi:branched-chain amino acid transport system ATP-binding protein
LTALNTAPSADKPDAAVTTDTGLRIEDLTVAYGNVVALDRVGLTVAPGEIVALLGANGAGKSSLLDAVSGLAPVRGGTIRVDGVDLSALPAHRRAGMVAQVPEGRRLFPGHTVAENLELAAFRASRDERRSRLDEVHAVLPRLPELASREAVELSGGEQQMVALGRGLMGGARILMIDELSLGLAPNIAAQFADTLLDLRTRGHAILLVEQYVSLALRVADRVVMLDRGRVVGEGTPEQVRAETEVLEQAYLGGGRTPAPASGADGGEPVAPPAPPSRTARAAAAGTVLGGALLAAATFAPWLHFTAASGTGELTGWDLPRVWAAVPLALGVVLALAGLVRLRRGPLSVTVAATAAVAGAAATAAIMTRTWLLAAGLPYANAAVFSRAWGLLVALDAAAIGTAAAVRLLMEARAARKPGRPA